MNWRFICIGFEIHSATKWGLKYWFCGTLVWKWGNGTLQNYDSRPNDSTFLLCLFVMADLVSVKVLLVQAYSRSPLTKTQGRSLVESLDIESLDIESLDIESLDIESLDIESLDIESLDIESYLKVPSFLDDISMKTWPRELTVKLLFFLCCKSKWETGNFYFQSGRTQQTLSERKSLRWNFKGNAKSRTVLCSEKKWHFYRLLNGIGFSMEFSRMNWKILYIWDYFSVALL